MPLIAIFSMIQIGHPYLVASFGEDSWKTGIALDKESDNGHRVGDELEVGMF
jgi:hypothetical protein